MKKTIKVFTLLAASLALTAFAHGSPRTYELWEPEPAPNNGRMRWTPIVGQFGALFKV
jgi:hypothetical protein